MWPNFQFHRGPRSLQVFPRLIACTFFDGRFFFTTVPLMEILVSLHAYRVLPTVKWLP
jgi:hypothetical protein